MQIENEKSRDFDQYSSSYAELLDDPLRTRFARNPIYFQTRKWGLIQTLLSRTGVTPATMSWLDVGCGQGELLNLGGDSFAQSAGCDPSTGMLASSTPHRTYKQTSLVELPFADNTFDFVTIVCVLHHVRGTDRTRLINEIRRVLKPGGLCCTIEHNPWNPLTQVIVKRCPVDAEAKLLTAHEGGKLLAASGFLPLRREYFLYLPEKFFYAFSAVEKMLSFLPFGGQYALLFQAPSS